MRTSCFADLPTLRNSRDPAAVRSLITSSTAVIKDKMGDMPQAELARALGVPVSELLE
jgi:hypothetical protein